MEIQNNAFGSQVRFEDPDVVHYESGVEQHKMTQDDDETITEGQFSQSAKKGSKMLASGTFVRSWWSELFFCIGGLVTFMGAPPFPIANFPSASSVDESLQSSSSFFGCTTRSRSLNGLLG